MDAASKDSRLEQPRDGGVLMQRMVRCDDCKGVGKVQWPNARCNCGSGEGCDLHDEAAISLWGKKCNRCDGTGKVQAPNEKL